jgi:hypothetical protein
MGTNYYLRQPPCPYCNNTPVQLHIGKSSSGWNFALRIYPKIDAPVEVLGQLVRFGAAVDHDVLLKSFGVIEICELEDWLPLFERFPIYDENDAPVSAADMRAEIADRSHPRGLHSRLTAGPDLMGPYHDPSRTDTLAGKGTYDLCNYDFS